MVTSMGRNHYNCYCGKIFMPTVEGNSQNKHIQWKKPIKQNLNMPTIWKYNLLIKLAVTIIIMKCVLQWSPIFIPRWHLGIIKFSILVCDSFIQHDLHFFFRHALPSLHTKGTICHSHTPHNGRNFCPTLTTTPRIIVSLMDKAALFWGSQLINTHLYMYDTLPFLTHTFISILEHHISTWRECSPNICYMLISLCL